jgi:hypothetical protein
LGSALENVERFAAMGGLIACGSDAGAWTVPHGCETEENLLRSALGEKTADILRRGNAKIMATF